MRKMTGLVLMLFLLLLSAVQAAAEPAPDGRGTVLQSYETESEDVSLLRAPDGTLLLRIVQTGGSIDEISVPEGTSLEAYHIEPGYVTVFADGAPGCVTWRTFANRIRMTGFRVGSRTYGIFQEYLSVHDEDTGVLTLYRDDGSFGDAYMSFADVAAFAQNLHDAGEWVFSVEPDGSVMRLPSGEELPLPEMDNIDAIAGAYDRGSRIFLSVDTADGGHLLRIVTKGETAEVLDIPVPWTCWFDSYHVGPNDDTVLYPSFDVGGPDEYLEMSFEWEDGCWKLDVINNGWEVIGFREYDISRDTDLNVVFGVHPWHTLETLDWSTLPRTFAQAAAGMTKEGWLFAAEDLSLRASPDGAAETVASCAADTPLAVIRFEGEWALVGLHQEDMWGPNTGYVPVESLRAEPVSAIPGGEADGWFYTMTVEDGLLRFDSPMTECPFTPLRVYGGFEGVARALFREQGYAATPARFDPALYPYLDGLIYEEYAIHDLFLTENAAVISVDMGEGRCRLEIVSDPAEKAEDTNVYMPAPFHFDRENWFWGEIRVVMDE